MFSILLINIIILIDLLCKLILVCFFLSFSFCVRTLCVSSQSDGFFSILPFFWASSNRSVLQRHRNNFGDVIIVSSVAYNINCKHRTKIGQTKQRGVWARRAIEQASETKKRRRPTDRQRRECGIEKRATKAQICVNNDDQNDLIMGIDTLYLCKLDILNWKLDNFFLSRIRQVCVCVWERARARVCLLASGWRDTRNINIYEDRMLISMSNHVKLYSIIFHIFHTVDMDMWMVDTYMVYEGAGSLLAIPKNERKK